MTENLYSKFGSKTKIQIGHGGKEELKAMGDRYRREAREKRFAWIIKAWKKLTNTQSD